MTIVTNVATYVPCKMKQKSTKYVYKFFLGEFITPDIVKNYDFNIILPRHVAHVQLCHSTGR